MPRTVWLCLLLSLGVAFMLPANFTLGHADISRLIEKSELESIIGQPLSDPISVDPQNEINNASGAISSCEYISQGAERVSLCLSVDQTPTHGVIKINLLTSDEERDVWGVGKLAMWFHDGDRVELHAWAQSGMHIWVSIGGIASDSVAVAKAKQIAIRMLARL